jgi:hypothetical protein
MMVHATLSRREAGRSQDPAWGTDLQPITMALETLPDDTPVSVVIGERKRAQLARLADAGIRTLGDARTLCLLTAAYCGTPMRDPPEQIDAARAALGSSPTHRCRGVIRVEVSRAARSTSTSTDIDNVESGVYLWGALVTKRSGWSAASPSATTRSAPGTR